MSSPTPLSWETVTVFISSTFNDMHAERDYLVKRVFPELREWCEQRKLRLVDIDLRWGVTEADATSKNTVKVCLSQIDKARPFFLCFLGQRRGWVPSRNEIDPATCTAYPELKGYVGAASVTEMEILHAVVNPLNDSARAEHAFFYHRDPSYLKDLSADPPFLRNTYTNEGIEDPEARAKADADLRSWLEDTIPRTRRPLHHYTATWSPEQRTPELALPLQCPSSLPENQERWREQWREAGIEPSSLDLTENPELEQKAKVFNALVTAARLTKFRCGDEELAVVILRDLQHAIAARYPDRDVILPETPLQKELDQQAQFLELNSTGFIERTGDFDALNQYVDSDSQDLFVLTAPAGMGKTMLLANWIRRFQGHHGDERPVYYRFIGASDGSTTVDAVLRSLLSEIKGTGYLADEIPIDPQELRTKLGDLLKAIGETHPVLLVIDALNQLESGLADLTWIPRNLPAGVKLVISFKREGGEAEQLARHFREEVPQTCAEVKPFDSLEDRKEIVDAYLDQYLKQLDDTHVQALITSPGAENPLFLMVVLSELRVFGSFGNLGQKIRDDFGTTPAEAFDAVLTRLEHDPAFTAIPFAEVVPLLFGLLSHARVGLSEQELVGLLTEEQIGSSDAARQQTVRLLLRQVRPFIATRQGRSDFFYDSFRLAAVARYESENPQRGQRRSQDWHRSLGEYFEALPAWVSQDEMKPTLRRAAELPYHLAWACMGDHLAELILREDLFEAVVYGLGPYEAIRDIEYIITPPTALKTQLSTESMEAITSLQGALRLSQHVLAPQPEELPSQLYGRLVGCGNPTIERMLEGLRARTHRLWLRPVTATLQTPGGPLIKTLIGHTKGVTAVAMSFDGRRVVSGSYDHTLKVWDLESGRVLATLTGHTDSVAAVAVTPDGRRTVSGSWDHTLKVWDTESGQEICTLTGHAHSVTAVAVIKNGTRAISGSIDGTLRAWDLENGRELFTLSGNQAIGSLAVTADGRRAISGSGDGVIIVWDLEKNRILWTLNDNTDGKRHFFTKSPKVAVTPDGVRAISASSDTTFGDIMSVWDLESGQEFIACRRRATNIESLAVTPDGRRIITGFESSVVSLEVWDLATMSEREKCSGHTNSVYGLAVTPDSRYVVSASADRTLKVWDIENDRNLRRPADYQDGRVVWAVTPGCRFAFTKSNRHGLEIWDLESGRVVGTHANYSKHIYAAAVTPDGRRAVSVSGDRDNAELKIWDLGSGQVLGTLTGHRHDIMSVAMMPDGRRAISGSRDQTVKVWDLENGQQLTTLVGHTAPVLAVAVVPDGRIAVSGSSDMTLKVWNLETGSELNTLAGHSDRVRAVALFSDGCRVISASDDHTLRIWDLVSGRVLGTLNGHSGDVRTVAVMPDDHWVVSGSEDYTLKVWDHERKVEVASFTAEAGINAVATSNITKKIFVVDEYGKLYVFILENDITDPCMYRSRDTK